MKSKKIIISISEVDDMKLVGLELKEITKEEAIAVLNRCLNRLLNDHCMRVDIINETSNQKN